MTPRIVDRRKYRLVGMDYFGDPVAKAPGWSEQNGVGLLWKRFMAFEQTGGTQIPHAVAGGAGFEVWVGVEGVTTKKDNSIFVGVEVSTLEDIPLALVGKTLPETRYAVFTMKGEQFRTELDRMWNVWLPASGHTKSHDYLIEYYDPARFRGLQDPTSEIDFMIPVV